MSGDINEILSGIIDDEEFRERILKLLTYDLSPSELQTLLLDVYRKRVEAVTPSELLKQRLSSRFLRPAEVAQREGVKLDYWIYELLPDEFDSIELSPVAVLGGNSVLAGLNQSRVLSTIRPMEVLSDPTVAMAFECATRRRDILKGDPKSMELVRLCTSARSLRLQVYDDATGFTPHFRTFTMATAGRARGRRGFENVGFGEHLDFYLSLLEFMREKRFRVNDVEVNISHTGIMSNIAGQFGIDVPELSSDPKGIFARYGVRLPAKVESVSQISPILVEAYSIAAPIQDISVIESTVIDKLRVKHPSVDFQVRLERADGAGYYSNLCFDITATDSGGTRLYICDGGMTDWTEQLLQSRKERLIVSMFGSEFLLKYFRP